MCAYVRLLLSISGLFYHSEEQEKALSGQRLGIVCSCEGAGVTEEKTKSSPWGSYNHVREGGFVW